MAGHEHSDAGPEGSAGDWPTTEELWGLVIERTGLERIEILVELSSRVEGEDIGAALALAEEAVGAARAELSDDHLVGALLHCGRLLSGEQRYVEASTALLEAATLSSHGSDAVRTGHSFLMAGDALASTDDLDGAVSALGTSETAFLCEEEWLGAAYAAQRAGRALAIAWRHEEALACFTRARANFQRGHLADQILETDHLRALVLREQGRYDEAVAVLTSCLAVSPTVHPEAEGSLEHFRLGRVYRSAERYPLAIEHLTRAHRHAVAHAHIHDAGQCLRELALCHFHMDPADEPEALRLLAQARAHYDLAGCIECRQECDEEHAEWLVILDRFDEAAAVNRLLADDPDPAVARAGRLRLVANLQRMGRHEEALMELPTQPDPDWPSADQVRERQLRAVGLLALECEEQALECATQGLALVDDTTDPEVRAGLLDVRAAFEDPDSARNDRAQAIAYYLAAGRFDRARELAQTFIPAPRPDRTSLEHETCGGAAGTEPRSLSTSSVSEPEPSTEMTSD